MSCNCAKCDFEDKPEDDRKMLEKTSTSEYMIDNSSPHIIKCEHIPGNINSDPEGMHIWIGHKRVVSLCGLCTANLQNKLVSSFLRDSLGASSVTLNIYNTTA